MHLNIISKPDEVSRSLRKMANFGRKPVILMYPASMYTGSVLAQKVRMRCLVGISLLSRPILICCTLVTCCSLQPSRSSVSLKSSKSCPDMTPCVLFKEQCGITDRDATK